MHYPQLTALGSSFAFEEGTSGHRTNSMVWSNIETKLKAAILDLRSSTSKPTAVSLAGTSIADRKAFFLKAAEANKVDKSEDIRKAAAAVKARKDIAYYRKWLAREGASADDDGSVDMAPMGHLTVYYDNALLQQGLTKLHISAGVVHRDNALTTRFSSKDMVTHVSGPGKAIFVMSAEGNIHVASHVVGHYHHSSLLAGQPVACAGEIEVANGIVKWLSNKSGHYAPNPNHLLQVLHQLQKKAVNMNFPLKVIYHDHSFKEFNDVGAFLTDRQLNDEPDYELNKLLAYGTAGLDDSILLRNNWRWRKPTETAGVYDITTDTLVPHKTVRAWLKLQGYSATPYTESGALR